MDLKLRLGSPGFRGPWLGAAALPALLAVASGAALAVHAHHNHIWCVEPATEILHPSGRVKRSRRVAGEEIRLHTSEAEQVAVDRALRDLL